MNKKTKYYFLSKCFIVSTILIIVFSVLLSLSKLYRNDLPMLFDALMIILKAFNWISIIILVSTLIYLVYQVSLYLRSRFYLHTKINFFEAIYYGFLDIYIVYDRIQRIDQIKDLSVDMKKNMITFQKDKKYYYIIFLELFGRISNKMDNEMWTALSKPKKKFGRRIYQRKLKFPNPLKQLNEYLEEQDKLNIEENNQRIGYVVLNGFYKADKGSKQIIAPYEVTSIVEK